MAAACARKGKTIAVSAQWEDLALCGAKQFKADIAKSVRASLQASKAGLAADASLPAASRREAMAQIDAAMRDVERDLRASTY
jgi:hypothetical protein